jgi:hypothetical protein
MSDNLISIIVVLCIFIAYIISYKFYNKDKNIEIISLIIIFLIFLNEIINSSTAFGLILLSIKGIASIIFYYTYKSNINQKIYNIFHSFHDKKIDYIILLKNYLPIAILNGFIMIALYLYTISKLRVDLSLASNCLKSDFNVEYATIRHKVNSFAKNNDANLKEYLILSIISFIVSILSILYISYYDIIELQYIMIIPILIFIIIFSSIIIDNIDKKKLGKDSEQKTKDNDIGLSIILSVLKFIIIGFFVITFIM